MIVPFTAQAMFELVADVESYPEFLPGCSAAHIHATHENQVTASIAIAQGPLTFEFVTCNELTPYSRISMALKKGPFSHLQGTWEFKALESGSSKVSLSLRFAFQSQVMDLLLGPPFGALCNRLVDAFARRAHDIHS